MTVSEGRVHIQAGGHLACQGHLVQEKTGSIRLSGHLSLGANWHWENLHPGQHPVLADGGWCLLGGLRPQSMTGAVPLQLSHFHQGNPAGLSLGQDLSLSGILRLDQGIIQVDEAYKIRIHSSAHDAIQEAGYQTYIAGKLERKMEGEHRYTFPVGTEEKYALTEIQLTNPEEAQYLAVTYRDHLQSLPHPIDNYEGLEQIGHWRIYGNENREGNIDLGIWVPQASLSQDPENLSLLQFNGMSWAEGLNEGYVEAGDTLAKFRRVFNGLGEFALAIKEDPSLSNGFTTGLEAFLAHSYPYSTQQSMHIYLPRPDQGRLQLWDSGGRLVWNQSGNFPAGWKVIPLDASQTCSPCLLRFTSGQRQLTRKIW
ncbi:MAG: hypothetical protein AAFR61_19220 [Bacteroidota bacterium]